MSPYLLSFIVKESIGQTHSYYLKTFATNLLMEVDFGVCSCHIWEQNTVLAFPVDYLTDCLNTVLVHLDRKLLILA